MFQATRRRLAIWYTAVTAILLLLFATGMFFYVRSTLIERIDDTLNHVVEVVSRSLVIEPVEPRSRLLQVNLETSFRDNFLEQEDDHIDLEWFTPTGELKWSTFVEPPNLPLHTNNSMTHRGETIALDAVRTIRQVTQQVALGRQVLGYLRVSHPWFEVTKPIQELVLDLSLGISAMIGLVGAVGWFLSGLAMQPIRESYQRLRQFTADASHELRNPIAVIQTNVQVALSEPEGNPEQVRSYLLVTERLTRRLGKLVDDLLFLARQDSGMVAPQWATFDLRDLLDEVLEEQGMIAAEKGIDLTLKTDSLTAPMEGDRTALARAFTNVVSNAIQYTPENGKITIELQSTKRGNQPLWNIKVIDTGIGIPDVAVPQLFDRFYRVDPARSKQSGGSGLGLAIVQSIVETHQGTIQVESEEGKGTIFAIGLLQVTRSTTSG
jgi:two-component system, OmpR family, manganese sensing sensor histidine kinase